MLCLKVGFPRGGASCRRMHKIIPELLSGWVEDISVCRMIVACGVFSVVEVMNAARAMAEGKTVEHDGSIKQHTHGWGCLWINEGQIRTLRGGGSFIEALSTINLSDIDTDFLAVHVRHATLSKNRGVEFAHPLRWESGTATWYVMHNGFLPTVYRCLGLPASSFDSAEYLEYIVGSLDSGCISQEYLMSKLTSLSPGGSSGNFFLVTQGKAWAWQWFSENTSCPAYFTMRHFKNKKVEYVASEVIPFLADESEWRPMQNGELYEFKRIEVRDGRAP